MQTLNEQLSVHQNVVASEAVRRPCPANTTSLVKLTKGKQNELFYLPDPGPTSLPGTLEDYYIYSSKYHLQNADSKWFLIYYVFNIYLRANSIQKLENIYSTSTEF